MPWAPDPEMVLPETRGGLSRGMVSRLLKSLVRNGYVRRHLPEEGRSAVLFEATGFDGLLDDWKSRDVWRKRARVHQFSLLESNPAELARSVQNAFPAEDLCFTQWFAASLRHPYATVPVVSAYLRKERSLYAYGARRVESGGNLWLVVPTDEEVFFDTQRVGGFCLVSDVQIYLDLLQVGLRGPDQAEELRKWEGFAR